MSHFAAGLGLHPNSLGSIERRELVCPSKWRLPLAQALGSDPNALFDGEGFAFPA
jgi:hypothetical protein